VNEKTSVCALYKKLLSLYPREFRERLEESMEQTFHDLYKERRAERFSFILWTFAETGMGIVREHVLLITEGASMKTIISNPRFAPVISFILCVLPFMILEWSTRSKLPRSNASPILWVVLWFLSTGFMVFLMLVVQNLRQAGTRSLAHPFALLSIGFFVVFGWLWVALVGDQMPCFLGGSGC
jgi:hypothetical protein